MNLHFTEKVILLLSDGKDLEDSVDEIMSVIAEGNSRIPDKVVIFTYGIGGEFVFL